jgi:hypothetical protein
VSRTVAIVLTLTIVLMMTACQRPASRSPVPAEGGSPHGHVEWTDRQRWAFRAALRSAQETLYRRLRQIRVRRAVRLERLIHEDVISAEEVRAMAASAPIRRVDWLPDDRCRVRIGIGAAQIVGALNRWDTQNRWGPHDHILKLNASAMFLAEGTSDEH